MARNGFAAITLLLILVIPVAFFLGFYFFRSSSTSIPIQTSKKQEVFIEKIPGSQFHSPDATWWGYNQSKIVRYKDKVFTYYILNEDDSNKTPSKFVVMIKDGEEVWEEGASFTTSRPGNLLIDSNGVLHAFVFQPFDVQKNDSWGKIIHYYFPNSASGDIKNYQKEIIVDNDGKSETANIRVGAAIGQDDTMAISFGLTKFNPKYREQSEHIYFKKPDEKNWNHIFVDGLPHDYYYPFTLVSKDSFYLLPIQDDFNDDGNPKTYDNIYQKIMFLEYSNRTWKNELVADLSNHEQASKKPKLLEQEDFYLKDGKIHILYKEFLDPTNTYSATAHWHKVGNFSNWKEEKIKIDLPGINWVRLVEVEGGLYYLATAFKGLYISKVGSNNFTELSIPDDALNPYPYIATAKGGTKPGAFIDVLLLGADQKLFQEGKNTNYYIRIPKSEFTRLNNY